MKNYFYIACASFTLAINASPFCCHNKAITSSPREQLFEQQLALLQSQCADNPGQLHTLVAQAIAQREQAIKEGKQRQQQLEKLYAQLNDENDDSQDDISSDDIISVLVPDNSYIPASMHHDIQAQYQEVWDAWYPESVTGVDEKASLAYLCAEAIGHANNVRQQEIEKLRSLSC